MVLRVRRGVVEEDLDAVRARFLEALDRPHVEQIGQPARRGRVVAGLLVRHQQPGVLRPALARGKAEFGIEQDRARVPRQHLGHQDLELLEFLGADLAALLLGQRFLQRPALIHGRGGNHAARIRHRLHSRKLPRCELHVFVSLCEAVILHRET